VKRPDDAADYQPILAQSTPKNSNKIAPGGFKIEA